MYVPSAESIWNLNHEDLVTLLDSQNLTQKSHKIHFYTPNFTYYKHKPFSQNTNLFPSISITGSNCTLNCKHCAGHLLINMYHVTTPKNLLELCNKLKQNGTIGCLISGGCLPNGAVPIKAFIPTISKIKQQLNFTIYIHTGLINTRTASLIKKTNAVDAILIDIPTSQNTISNIYNLNNITLQDYKKTLETLQKINLNFIPHVTVGLSSSNNNVLLDNEYTALHMISQTNPTALVIIAFTPLPKTDMAKIKPPTPYDIARVIATARTMMPNTSITLGCMRPKNKQHATLTDILAIKAGVNAIAYPNKTTIEYTKTNNWTTTFSPYCCAKIFTDINKKH